jgi:hypothetical protein
MPRTQIARIIQIGCFIAMAAIAAFHFGDSGHHPNQPNAATGEVIAIHGRSGLYYVSHAQQVTDILALGLFFTIAVLGIAARRYISEAKIGGSQ